MQVQNGLSGAVARAYGSSLSRIDSGSARAAAAGGASGAGVPRTDSIAVSSTLQEVGRVRAAVAGAPDNRAEQVAALRASVAAGTYAVDTTALAATLMGAAG